jgi:enediyne biosynthesis protein E4
MKCSFCLFVVVLFLSSCGKFSKETFRKLSPSRTGVDFVNILFENDTLNYTIFPYMYMGGGVSVGDINNDGLDDIFFTGNLVPNKLYLNKGNMEFEDISEKAGIAGNHQWFTGSTMADVNNDGWLDIYVCVSAKYQPSDNLLFINNQDNTFTESGKLYGVNDKYSSVQATFFDYDNDGDLDLFVANYPIVLVSQGADFYRTKMNENKFEESGHLYRNNGNKTFTDVTDEAGVRNFGMSIGLVAMDFNNDGWKDLYISNDFNPPDYFYLNNKNGTFSEVVKEATFQTSIFGMGFDAADINNDGLLDMYQIDMTPEDHYRRIVNLIPMRRETFYRSVDSGLHYQYMQNSLQLNNGIFNGLPVYSNITLMAGVSYTDWSWGGLFADFDNDGYKDLFVSNGVLKDINNQDILANPRNNMYFGGKQKEYRPELFPSTPVHNYMFRNNGNLTFTNKAKEWGFNDPNLSNGVSYSDLDNDGDLDIVISIVNEAAGIYENKAVPKDNHYLKIKLNGTKVNPFGLGSIVTVKTGNTIQKQELTLTRGYQSSVPATVHFGLGKAQIIDELVITWPDGKQQQIKNLKTDQFLILNYSDAAMPPDISLFQNTSFTDVTAESGIHFVHHEDKYDDFEYEPLLPYKNSQLGPGLAVGDVNGDGLDDFFIGNAKGSKSALYVQNDKGTFKEVQGPWTKDTDYEVTGALFFDADGDGRQDLILIGGGNDPLEKEDFYRPRLFLNHKEGFIGSDAGLPVQLNLSGKCVKAADFDQDGDLDLFLGGRIIPGNYPYPANSYILKNNGKKENELRFDDVTGQIAPALTKLGLVTDALWDDYDQDGDADLIVTGEWMNIRFFENTPSGFKETTDKMGFKETTGWWFDIESADVDLDGDTDYMVGNLGMNYRYKSGPNQQFDIYANDFDVNGKTDIVLAYTEKGIQYPANSFDATSRQIPVIRNRYESYHAFASASLQDIYGAKMLEISLHYRINTFAHCWIENKGKGVLVMHELPIRTQCSSVNDMVMVNFRNKPSIIIAGNLYGSETETPRNDASIGLVLPLNKNNCPGVLEPSDSHLMVRGEVKAIGKIKLATGKNALLFALNNDALKLIRLDE